MHYIYSKKKILVIEDTVSTRNLFLEGIKAKGYLTIGAENGVIGLYVAQKELPNLIISDIIMPKLDGYGVLRALRQNPATATIPLIFVSAKTARADIRKGIEMGADDYLTKPCSLEELVRAIAACLEKRAVLQKWYTAQFQSVPKPPIADTTKSADLESIFAHDPLMKEVFHFIDVNFHRPITLGNVAQAVGYSSAYLTDRVRRQTGQTVQSWIIQRRMAAACSLLLETDERVEKIAVEVGYQCAVHFFRQFRQYHGTTPQNWRRAHRDHNNRT
jgi:YesN/AraC family two-component response regulator